MTPTPLWLTFLVVLIPLLNSWALKLFELHKLKPKEEKSATSVQKAGGKGERFYRVFSLIMFCLSCCWGFYWLVKLIQQPVSNTHIDTLYIVLYVVIIWENLKSISLTIFAMLVKQAIVTDQMVHNISLAAECIRTLAERIKFLFDRVEKLEEQQAKKKKKP